MSNYQRLISYIYEYEGGAKGRNIGFAKLETRGGQCKVTVSIKKIYAGGNPMSVYLLSGQGELSVGNAFVRNGVCEFRAILNSASVEGSGLPMTQFYGLSVHESENAWRSYTTIWEDAVAHAAEIELAGMTSENVREQTVRAADLGGSEAKTAEEALPISREIEEQLEREEQNRLTEPILKNPAFVEDITEAEEEVRSSETAAPGLNETGNMIVPQPAAMDGEITAMDEEADSASVVQEWNGESVTEQSADAGFRGAEQPADADFRGAEASAEYGSRGPNGSAEYGSYEPEQSADAGFRGPEASAEYGFHESEQPAAAAGSYESEQSAEAGAGDRREEPARAQDVACGSSAPSCCDPSLVCKGPESRRPLSGPDVLRHLEEEEQNQFAHQNVWGRLRKMCPKIQAFDYENPCEVLTIKPQDIGLLPRETWIFGNNSFLLHGYYNYRYLILARLESPEGGRPRYLLGVPGHYYSNEKYMATMFGFANFVLSKHQPPKDGRFGYWYTDIKVGE